MLNCWSCYGANTVFTILWILISSAELMLYGSSANRSRTLWSAVKKVILQNSLWILYLIPYELNLPVSLTFCWHTKHMTEKLMTELGPKKKQKQIPLYGGIHWCPHPLLQHFWFLGQSLSWEHISTHQSYSKLFWTRSGLFCYTNIWHRYQSLNAEWLHAFIKKIS